MDPKYYRKMKQIALINHSFEMDLMVEAENKPRRTTKDIYEAGVPDVTLQTIKDYVIKGWEPGGFVRAVLENNLSEAIARADENNLASLKDIVMYVYWCVPGIAWKSPDLVDEWMKHRQEVTKVETE